MTSRAILGAMKLKGTVKNGVVAVDLPDGTPVTVLVEEMPLPTYQLDDHGRLIITPDLEADIAAGEAEADRGGGMTIDELRTYLRQR
ncbi:MAG: hypothetical protein JWP01_765 [Myxococcales bacterium]|nr:hypothetical protein [Myxococcales bacterium]